MNKTSIEWTSLSANPLKCRRKSDGKVVWGCVKTSRGCAHCYAEAIALRFERGKLFNAKNMEELEPFLDEAELRVMLTKKTVGGVPVSGARCFVGDMTDVFGEWVPDELLDRLFAVFALRRDVTWQVLTKRAGRMRKYLDPHWMSNGGWHREDVVRARVCERLGVHAAERPEGWGWPLPNVHLGVSVEDQQRADERREHLKATPAAVRFVSYEPALGPVDWSGWEFLDWLISGGESGPKARPTHPDWHREARDFCGATPFAYHFKQWGEWGTFTPERAAGRAEMTVVHHTTGANGPPPPLSVHSVEMFRVGKKAAGRLLDGRTWDEFPAPAEGSGS